MEKNLQKIAEIKQYILDYHDNEKSEIDSHNQTLLLKLQNQLINDCDNEYNQLQSEIDKFTDTYLSIINKVESICNKNLSLFDSNKIVPINCNIIDILKSEKGQKNNKNKETIKKAVHNLNALDNMKNISKSLEDIVDELLNYK